MRVTQSMMSSNMLRNLGTSYGRLDKYNEQLASGKKINRPSDDPVVAMKGIYYRSDVTQVEQYQRNLSEATMWAEASDDALNNVNQALQRMRELTVQGSTGSNSEGSREAIAKEFKQLIEHIASVGNTQVGDKYIFNGLNTTQQPLNLSLTTDSQGVITSVSGAYTPPVPPATFGNFDVAVSNGVNVTVNTDPMNIFDQNTIQKMVDIYNGLQSATDTSSTTIQNGLDEIDKILQNVLTARTKVGATQNRIDMIEDRLGTQEVIANKIMSDNEDADIEKVITDLKTQESVHNAALGVGARIIQPSLLDFLR